MKLATLGPAGTFSEVAAGLYQPNQQHYIQLLDSLVSCLDAVGQECDAAVVPIENLTEGFVSPVVDYLVRRPLRIQAEIRIPVSFQCLSNSASPQQVWAQFVAAGQCNQYLHSLGLPLIHTASNALSMEALIAAKEPSAAVVPKHLSCPEGLQMLKSDIADNPHNETRFVVLSATSEEPEFDKDKRWKSSLLLIDDNDHPGLLVDSLQVFARQQINLTSIVSRPAGRQFGDYHFFIDFDGHRSEAGVALALEELTEMNNIHWLGSYPAAEIGKQ
ncbi:prephenate dehydratase [Idiomarina sp. UBA4520]|uniref:prephenate dehydratase n=1 Tax=Idiomarina sp. UBA4520 TaxID=1946647 RepID=UPI000A8CCDF7|nr:prephenate dehydratase domain-containing protein [Idiomarina sp. UBA4520]|tara:strand:+ start:228 stop:1049 length:822 start_codon:yes stop_codon:yes gene_type:complete